MRSTVWKKFNLSYHLISLRNRIGPFNSGVWVLSTAHASRWLNGSLIGDRRLGRYDYHITLSVQTQRRKLRILPAKGSRFGLASHGHSKANFSRWSSGRIRRRVNSSAQWHTSSPAQWSSVTRLTSASRHGVVSGSFPLFSTKDGRRCLFGHWGSSCISTWNHFEEAPYTKEFVV
jgi:hypothetical protein